MHEAGYPQTWKRRYSKRIELLKEVGDVTCHTRIHRHGEQRAPTRRGDTPFAMTWPTMDEETCVSRCRHQLSLSSHGAGPKSIPRHIIRCLPQKKNEEALGNAAHVMSIGVKERNLGTICS